GEMGTRWCSHQRHLPRYDPASLRGLSIRPRQRLVRVARPAIGAHWHLVARISWADVWGRVGVEDHPSFRERDFAVVGQDDRRPVTWASGKSGLAVPAGWTLP